jgi:hypothetical protein
MTKEHYSFVISNWLKQNLFNGFKPLPARDSYYKNHQTLIKQVLGGYVAVNDEDDTQFIGFICGNDQVIHFVFVKEIFRKLGIAKMLYVKLGSPKTFTHITKDSIKIIDKTFTYDPYLFYMENNHGKNQEI